MVTNEAVLDQAPLAALRGATRDAHERLHVHPGLACLNGGPIVAAEYRRVLKSFYGFYAPYEDLYARQADERFAAFPPGIVRERLDRDLRVQGIDPQDIELIGVSQAPWPLAKIIGYLYLREGSGLGGQVISRHLLRSLGVAPGIDNHFFHAYGGETGPQWKRFIALLNDLSDDFDHAAAAAFAANLFQELDRWLEVSCNG